MKTNIVENQVCKTSLLKYLTSSQTAFQFSDELIIFTQPQDGKYEYMSDQQKAKNMYSTVKNAASLKIFSNNDFAEELSQSTPFYDMIDWAEKDDLLILVNESLMLCLPGKSKKKILSNLTKVDE